MAVISFPNPKGGSGKTTLAVILADQFARNGYSLAFVDADPQKAGAEILAKMKLNERVTAGLSIVTDIPEDELFDRVNALAAEYDVVLVDLQGSANQAMLFAVGASDLIIVPAQPSGPDLKGAVKAITVARNATAMARKKIVTKVLLMRTSHLANHRDRNVRLKLESAGADLFKAELINRQVFQTLTLDGALPADDEPAAANCRAIYIEVVEALQSALAEATQPA